jgi:hypothetical protein
MHQLLQQSSATAAICATPREARLASEHRRLRQNLNAIITADARLVDLGPDPLIDQLLSASGFDRREAFSVRMLIARSGQWLHGSVFERTAIIASSRCWHRKGDRDMLLAVKEEAAKVRVRCLLVPQRSLAGPMRLSTAKMIASSQHVRCTATDRLRIIGHLQESGGSSSLLDCAGQIVHFDPVGAVLAMVTKGDLSIDRTRPIGPSSRIDCNL